jgi:hypothetical protein
MTGNPSIEDRAMEEDTLILAMARARLERPDLKGSISQIVAANDYASLRRAKVRLMNGQITRQEALTHVGSYARMNMIIEMLDMTQSMGWEPGWQIGEIYPRLAEIWSGSDPDDTDWRFEDMFYAARTVMTGADNEPLNDGTPCPTNARLMVYRGEANGNPSLDLINVGGLSWTLNRDVAARFACGAALRAPTQGVVYEGQVNREDVLAFIIGRGESEVMAAPERVTIRSYAHVNSPTPTQWRWAAINEAGEFRPLSLRARKNRKETKRTRK